MYVEANEEVKEIFSKLEKLNDLGKLKFLLYTFNVLNNNQVNSKSEVNPDLVEDDDLIIFNMEFLGLSSSSCTTFLQYLVSLYNLMDKENNIYEDNGNVIGLDYNEEEGFIISSFERLKYNDKLDVYSELFIRYDNETYFKDKITMLTFDSKLNGFDLANLTKKLKEKK